jgi:hypothetical protein
MIARRAFLVGIVIAAFSAAPFALAQSASNLSTLTTASVPPITLSLSDQYPQPYSSTALSVDSTTMNLADATLSVSVNGTNVYRGNVQPVTVTIGAPGATTVINVVVTSAGQTYPASISVDPGDVSLIEEPVASAPPLYLGKPLTPLGGEVRLVAIADFSTSSGAAIDPSTLSYTWMQDSDTLVSSSGIGRSAVIVDAPLEYRAGDYSVTVSTQDGIETGTGSVSLSAEDPTVRIYADDPLLGIEFDHALGGTYAIPGPEVSFYAAPYSFSTANGAPSIGWFLNGSAAGSVNLITLRPTGSGAGVSSLSVSGSEEQLYENASANLSLSYGAGGSIGLFGL